MKKLIFLTLSTGITILAIVLFVIFSIQKPKVPSALIFPTITQVQPPPFVSLPPENDISIFEKENIISKLPIETTGYNIEYLVESDTFVITIKESPYLQNKQAAEQFFIQNGVKDLSRLRMLYNSYRWVK